MAKMTGKDYQSFKQIYLSLPAKAEKAPKTEFVERIAAITKKSKKTIYCWLNGAQVPDALTQSVLEKELGVPCEILFPKREEE